MQDDLVSSDILEQIEGIKISEFVRQSTLPKQRRRKICNYQARHYVIVYVGKKLGVQSNTSSIPNSWIIKKGRGELFEPSDDLVNICEVCDSSR